MNGIPVSEKFDFRRRRMIAVLKNSVTNIAFVIALLSLVRVEYPTQLIRFTKITLQK
jgi:hypothetical protein